MDELLINFNFLPLRASVRFLTKRKSCSENPRGKSLLKLPNYSKSAFVTQIIVKFFGKNGGKLSVPFRFCQSLIQFSTTLRPVSQDFFKKLGLNRPML
jgi:hypothetical protein